MRRALLLSVVLVSGCRQASAPPVDTSAQNAAKTNKEVSDLLRKADTLTAVKSASVVAAPEPAPRQVAPAVNPPVAPVEPVQAKPPKSKADVMRDQAAAAFGDRLGTLRRTAEAARLKKDRFQQVCEGKKAAPLECQSLTADVSDASKTIERELGDIDEAARRSQIEPAVIHDLLAKYGF